MIKTRFNKIIQRIKKDYNGYVDFTINNRHWFTTKDGRERCLRAIFVAHDNTLVFITSEDCAPNFIKQTDIDIVNMNKLFNDDSAIMKYWIKL